MLREGLIALAFVAGALAPADYQDCKTVNNGPIVKQKPPAEQYGRQPDVAATTDYPVTEFFDGMPPPRFRGPAEMKVVWGELDRCGKPNMPGHPNARFGSCIRGGITYLPDPCAYPDETFARFTCHEIAHLRHWPKDHGP